MYYDHNGLLYARDYDNKQANYNYSGVVEKT